MSIAIVVGTRPEIIKMAPIIRYCRKNSINTVLIHTGQHYSYEMDRIFFRELELDDPDYNLEVGSHSHARQTALLLTRIEDVLVKESPHVVLVEGDTNSVLAGGLTAAKLHIPVGHVEAGLRSYDREMPEEINRILVDHISTFCFAPTESTKNILLQEGVDPSKIFVTGNTIVDAVYQNQILAEKEKDILKRFEIEPSKYFLCTLHRQENVDHIHKLKNIFKGLKMVCLQFKIPIIYPIHPRTKKRLEQFKIKIPEGVILSEPLGYFPFLYLLKNSALALTDSGGIQEESCILQIPCVTLRENTERPETLEVGSNLLAGTDPKKILLSAKQMINKKNVWENPFGDGKSAHHIVSILQRLN